MPHLKKETMNRLELSGRRMSNWLFNLSQSAYFVDYKESMKEMVDDWDASAAALHDELRSKKKTSDPVV